MTTILSAVPGIIDHISLSWSKSSISISDNFILLQSFFFPKVSEIILSIVRNAGSFMQQGVISSIVREGKEKQDICNT